MMMWSESLRWGRGGALYASVLFVCAKSNVLLPLVGQSTVCADEVLVKTRLKSPAVMKNL